jgi:DNA-binding Xre family transcriptional regulator
VGIANRQGVRLDAARLDRALDERGLTLTDLARLTGINLESLSRIRHGGSVRTVNFRVIAKALADAPVIPGAVLLLGDGEHE